jgi:hypothetical protein
MGRAKYWNGSAWIDIAPTPQEVLLKNGDTATGDIEFVESKGIILNDLDTNTKYRLVIKSGQLFIQEA